ncbi:MAG: lipoyl(octanoyl) transferase LipB [Solirubrobacterales bacterium]
MGFVSLGPRPYLEMLGVQERLVESRRDGTIGDTLLVLEHPATYTKGRRSEPADLLKPAAYYAERGIDVCETPRGGKVTYHGPGQLIIYPVIDLRKIGDQPAGVDRIDVAGFVAVLEAAMSAALAHWDVAAAPIEGLTGLWVSSGDPIPADANASSMAAAVARGEVKKIGSIGLRISRGISSHGLSLNVSCDLDPFSDITSCGIEVCEVSSLAAETESVPEVAEVGLAVAEALASFLGRDLSFLEPSDIGIETGISATA